MTTINTEEAAYSFTDRYGDQLEIEQDLATGRFYISTSNMSESVTVALSKEEALKLNAFLTDILGGGLLKSSKDFATVDAQDLED